MPENKKPVMAELSPASAGGGLDYSRWYTGGILTPHDSVLRSKGGDLSLYEELLRDDQVASCFQQRRRAVVSREWLVEAGGEKREDKKAADFIREVLAAIPFDQATDRMLYAVHYGYSVAEIIWARSGVNVVIGEIKVRDRKRFRFGADGSLRLVSMSKPQGEAMPEKKFWVFSAGGETGDDPYGLGLGHYLYWPVFFKRNDMKLWLTFLDKFAAPTAKGKYPKTASEDEKGKLLEALSAIASDTAIAVPEGMDVELIEAARRGTADYVTLHDRMNAAIAKIILSQTMTTDDGSSYSQSKTHGDVRDEVVKGDADLVCDSFNRSVVRWLCEWNFPSAAPPRVWRRVEPDPDLLAQAQIDEKLHAMGFKRTAESVIEVYGEGYEERPETGDRRLQEESSSSSLQSPASSLAGVSPSFAEGATLPGLVERRADQQAIADAAISFAEGWKEIMGPYHDELLTLLDETGDLALFRERLMEIASSAPSGGMADRLEKAIFAAGLSGRLRGQK